MSARRLFAIGVTTYSLAFVVWLLSPTFRESVIGGVVAIPPFSVYVFEHFGAPGLTDRNKCDWMWCKPTTFGIIFTMAVWLGAAWLVSIGIAHVSRSMRASRGGRSGLPPESHHDGDEPK